MYIIIIIIIINGAQPQQDSEVIDDVFDEILDADITAEDVKAAIRHLKNGKAAGPDGIIGEILKAAEESIVPFLVKYFNKLFKEGSFPIEWTKAIIVPLHKKGDPNDMDIYRGISLLSVLGKVFTFILKKLLTEWIDSNDVLSDAQSGFTKTYSTTDHIFILYACIEKYMLRNGNFYVAYVDFSKAFDTVRHPIL